MQTPMSNLWEHILITGIKRISEIRMKLTNSGYKTEVLDERLIIQLINSYNNPDIAYIEDQNYLESPLQVKI